ncbi:hypothetical protein SCB29_35730, partial [Paraburkholderia sp. SIMBA_055]
LVIAGLTVVDPIIAVVIGATLLGEAVRTPVWTLMIWVLAGAVAAIGVALLAKHHPQVVSESRERPVTGATPGRDESEHDIEDR